MTTTSRRWLVSLLLEEVVLDVLLGVGDARAVGLSAGTIGYE